MSTHDRRLEIRVDGQRLAATLVQPKRGVPGVLFIHGWGGSQEQYLARARAIAALGCIGLTFDLRGHAESDSDKQQVSREHNFRDAVAAYDALISHPGVDREAIAMVGSSYGGYLAALLTTQRPVKWLGLRVPAIYKDDGWTSPKASLHKDDDFRAYRQQALRPEDNRALRACAEFTGDVLIVELEEDDIVPHRTIMNFVDAAKQARSLTYRVIQGADHGLMDDEKAQNAYTTILVNWLTEMVFGARTHQTTDAGSAALQIAPRSSQNGRCKDLRISCALTDRRWRKRRPAPDLIL